MCDAVWYLQIKYINCHCECATLNVCNDGSRPFNSLWCRKRDQNEGKREEFMNREYNWKHLLTFAQFNFTEILVMAAVTTTPALVVNGFCMRGAHCFCCCFLVFPVVAHCGYSVFINEHQKEEEWYQIKWLNRPKLNDFGGNWYGRLCSHTRTRARSHLSQYKFMYYMFFFHTHAHARVFFFVWLLLRVSLASL